METVNLTFDQLPKSVMTLTKEVSELRSLLLNKQEPSNNSEKEFLTREETKNFFNISYPTLHDWTKKDLITPYKMGRKTFFKRSELVASLLNSKKAV